MWLTVCTSNRDYSVVNEEDVVSGNVTCGSLVKVLVTGVVEEATVIFIGRSRSQCDQYCRRLSTYSGTTETSSEQQVDSTFLNNSNSQNVSSDEVLNEHIIASAQPQLEMSKMKVESDIGAADVGRIFKKSDVDGAVVIRHDDVAPSTSYGPDNGKDNEDVNVKVPHLFFMELLRTMKKLRNECRARFNRLDDQLEDMATRVNAIEEFIQKGDAHSMPLSSNDASSSTSTQINNNDLGTSMLYDSSPSDENSKLQYPYPHLSEIDIDMIQREAKTITSFARKVDRILFASDKDRDSPIDSREDKAKTTWLKMLIRTLHPTANDLDDAARWATCRQAINDYCRRSGNHLSESERVHLLQLVANRSHEEAAAEFNRLHPDREPIRQSSVSRLIAKFKETGSVVDRPRCGRPRRSTDSVNAAAILAKFSKNPEKSLRQMAAETGMSRSSIHRILRAHREKS